MYGRKKTSLFFLYQGRKKFRHLVEENKKKNLAWLAQGAYQATVKKKTLTT
jgi:hypothetical protein